MHNDRTLAYRRWLALVDVVVIVLSIFFSRVIRAQFPYFLYELEKLFFMLPYVIVFRLLVNVFFEHYRTVYRQIIASDIIGLFAHHLLPTLILVIARFVSPIVLIRLPLSMIVFEYFITVSGMIIGRLLVSQVFFHGLSAESVGRGINVVLVVSGLGAEEQRIVGRFVDDPNYEVVAILTDKQELWETAEGPVRIVGDVSQIRDVYASHPGTLQAIHIPPWDSYQLRETLRACRPFGIPVLSCANGRVGPVSPRQLLETRTLYGDRVPQRLRSEVEGKQICVLPGSLVFDVDAQELIENLQGAFVDLSTPDECDIAIDFAPYRALERQTLDEICAVLAKQNRTARRTVYVLALSGPPEEISVEVIPSEVRILLVGGAFSLIPASNASSSAPFRFYDTTRSILSGAIQAAVQSDAGCYFYRSQESVGRDAVIETMRLVWPGPGGDDSDDVPIYEELPTDHLVGTTFTSLYKYEPNGQADDR